MLTLKTACVYGDAEVTKVLACDDDNMLEVGSIHRIEYPSYMNEPTLWAYEIFVISGVPMHAFPTFEAALDGIRTHMDDITKAFYAR